MSHLNFIIRWVSSRSGLLVLGKGWCHRVGFWVLGPNMRFLFRYTALGPELVYKIGILGLQHTIVLFHTYLHTLLGFPKPIKAIDHKFLWFIG